MKRIETEKWVDLKSNIPLETPFCIFIDPASACNFKCTFCMNSHIKSPSVMGLPLFKKIIDDLKEFNEPVKTIKLYGFGEPTLNKSFCEMVKYAKASPKVIEVNTTTNAGLLHKDLISEIVESGIDRINVSVYGTNTENYQKFTKSKAANYDKMVENLTDLYNRKPKNMILFIKTTGDYLTQEQKDSFNNTFGPISDGHDIEHTMNCWNGVNSVDKKDQVLGIYGQPLKEVDVCPYVFYSFLIQADGHVSSCFLDWNKKLVIGDVRNETVKQLWTGNMMNYVRKQMLEGKRKEHPICGKCNQVVAGMPVDLDEHKSELLKKIYG